MSGFREILEKRLEQADDLPAHPAIIGKLEEVFRSDDSDAADVADIISEDPVLAGRVLQVANSAFYAISNGEIASIRDAVARLGFAETRSLCTTLSLIRLTNDLGGDLDHQLFWKHSIVVAVTTSVLREFSPVVGTLRADEAYTAGLMHDIGVLIMDQYFPDIYRRIRDYAESEDMSCDEIERQELKMDHGEIGGILLIGWGIPASVVEAVRWHHLPERSCTEYKALAYTLHLAEFISTCLGIGDGGDGFTHGFNDAAWDALQLSVDDIPKIIEDVKSNVERCSTLVSLS